MPILLYEFHLDITQLCLLGFDDNIRRRSLSQGTHLYLHKPHEPNVSIGISLPIFLHSKWDTSQFHIVDAVDSFVERWPWTGLDFSLQHQRAEDRIDLIYNHTHVARSALSSKHVETGSLAQLRSPRYDHISVKGTALCKIWGAHVGGYEYAVFWDVTPCVSFKNQRFGRT
jgi:hypothetical protein